MKNTRSFLLLNVILLLINSLPSHCQKNFEIRGWQVHEYNIPKLTDAINKAPAYGINTVIFSHELFRSVEAYLNNPIHQKDINQLGTLAKNNNIDWYFWIHELDNIPPKFYKNGRVQFDDPELMPYITERYEKLISTSPSCKGFVLTFHESHAKIFQNSKVESKKDIDNRIVILTKTIYDVLKKYDKQLILRNFLYEPKEMEYFKKALSKLPKDIILMTKTTPHEFDPFYPPDPSIGNYEGFKQIVEIDLGVEKALGYNGVYAQGNYIKKYAMYCKDKGCIGMVGRARLGWDSPFENVHEINLNAFSVFLENPELPLVDFYDDWVSGKYGNNAAPYIVKSIGNTEYINHHARYFLGFWLTKWLCEDWDYYKYYYGHIKLRSLYKWTNDPEDKKTEELLYHPNPLIFEKLMHEKDTVLRLAITGFNEIKQAEKYLSPQKIKELKEGFSWLVSACRLQYYFAQSYFAHLIWINSRDYQYKLIALDALDKLQNTPFPDLLWERIHGKGQTSQYYINKYIGTIKWRIDDPEMAKKLDQKIMMEIETELIVD